LNEQTREATINWLTWKQRRLQELMLRMEELRTQCKSAPENAFGLDDNCLE